MIGAELFQLENFLAVLACGFLSGFLFDFANLVCFLCQKNYYVRGAMFFVATAMCCVVLFFLTLSLNYGQMRLYLCAAMALGVGGQRFLLAKPIEKTFQSCYNVFARFEQWINKKSKKTKKEDCHQK